MDVPLVVHEWDKGRLRGTEYPSVKEGIKSLLEQQRNALKEEFSKLPFKEQKGKEGSKIVKEINRINDALTGRQQKSAQLGVSVYDEP